MEHAIDTSTLLYGIRVAWNAWYKSSLPYLQTFSLSGISNQFNDEVLKKDKSRKTKNRSKKSSLEKEDGLKQIQLALGDDI